MRQKPASFALFVFVGILVCSLVSLEYPEFSTLTDDVSNDFTLDAASQQVPSLAVHARQFVASLGQIRTLTPHEGPSSLPAPAPAPRAIAVSDLLHLLSIQRT